MRKQAAAAKRATEQGTAGQRMVTTIADMDEWTGWAARSWLDKCPRFDTRNMRTRAQYLWEVTVAACQSKEAWGHYSGGPHSRPKEIVRGGKVVGWIWQAAIVDIASELWPICAKDVDPARQHFGRMRDYLKDVRQIYPIKPGNRNVPSIYYIRRAWKIYSDLPREVEEFDTSSRRHPVTVTRFQPPAPQPAPVSSRPVAPPPMPVLTPPKSAPAPPLPVGVRAPAAIPPQEPQQDRSAEPRTAPGEGLGASSEETPGTDQGRSDQNQARFGEINDLVGNLERLFAQETAEKLKPHVTRAKEAAENLVAALDEISSVLGGA